MRRPTKPLSKKQMQRAGDHLLGQLNQARHQVLGLMITVECLLRREGAPIELLPDELMACTQDLELHPTERGGIVVQLAAAKEPIGQL